MDISILTCVRDQDPGIFHECAQSVVAQEGNVEWIVVDDGSQRRGRANHEEIVRAAGRSVTTRFMPLDEGVGLSTARNVGLREVCGEWVVVLDSDDRLSLPLGATIRALPAHCLVASFDSIYFSPTISEYRSVAPFAELFQRYARTPLDPFLWWDFYYHGLIARRTVFEQIGGYRESFMVGEDQDVLLRATEVCGAREVAFVPRVGYYYRDNPDGVCSTRWNEVVRNYTTTMVQGAQRRGAPFVGCRFAGVDNIAGADIDRYEYQLEDGQWFAWESWKLRA